MKRPDIDAIERLVHHVTDDLDDLIEYTRALEAAHDGCPSHEDFDALAARADAAEELVDSLREALSAALGADQWGIAVRLLDDGMGATDAVEAARLLSGEAS